jgi:hypothetical protein
MFSIRECIRNYYYYLENTFNLKKKEILCSKPTEIVPDIPCVTINLSEEFTEKPTIIVPPDIEIKGGPYIPEAKIGSYFVANENFKKFKGPSRKRLDGSHSSNPNNGQVDLSKRPDSKVSE